MIRLPPRIVPLLICLTLVGCAPPQGAGLASQVLAGADAPDANFAVNFVTSENLERISSWPKGKDPNAAGGWISRKGGGAGSVIEAGDVITLSVWSNEENSLLAAPEQRKIEFPPMTVSPDGSVFLPYADKVYVAKMSPEAAREAVQKGLGTVIPSAQVQLSVTSGRRNEAELISGVPNPGAFPLPDGNFSILSLIAQGGGVPAGNANPQVRLTREGKIYGIAMQRLLADPGLDTVLRGGDKVFVEPDQRYFLSLGAARSEAQTPFPQADVSALDAMSLIGGLNDTSADPRGILILRDYPAAALRQDDSGPQKRRTVFAFDITTADGLFSAGDFEIQHKDLVLVTQSPLLNTGNVLGLIGRALGLAQDVKTF